MDLIMLSTGCCSSLLCRQRLEPIFCCGRLSTSRRRGANQTEGGIAAIVVTALQKSGRTTGVVRETIGG